MAVDERYVTFPSPDPSPARRSSPQPCRGDGEEVIRDMLIACERSSGAIEAHDIVATLALDRRDDPERTDP